MNLFWRTGYFKSHWRHLKGVLIENYVELIPKKNVWGIVTNFWGYYRGFECPCSIISSSRDYFYPTSFLFSFSHD